jgi:hypothetical protein
VISAIVVIVLLALVVSSIRGGTDDNEVASSEVMAAAHDGRLSTLNVHGTAADVHCALPGRGGDLLSGNRTANRHRIGPARRRRDR